MDGVTGSRNDEGLNGRRRDPYSQLPGRLSGSFQGSRGLSPGSSSPTSSSRSRRPGTPPEMDHVPEPRDRRPGLDPRPEDCSPTPSSVGTRVHRPKTGCTEEGSRQGT